MTPETEKYIRDWLEIAEHDLVSAQRLIEIEPYILDTACFHCQQSVEKNLKAFLVANGIEPERTHNISYLLVECGKFDGVFDSIDEKRLDTFAVVIRYPHSAELPTIDEARELFELAKSIKGIVLDRIGKVMKLPIVESKPSMNSGSEKLLSKKVKSDNPLLSKKKAGESLLPKNRVRNSKGKRL
ncbi:MAG: HEPN domain-containing protein [Sediminibacterium magnilacihabitans]|jgi:HEPN domain-containing protein|nr:HEPN domain-containing protein [Sediminibacterium magnilacihabitans]PQV60405.1 HEPN domain-containing protein [Sediminibacterium magnilacihabitans]